MTGSISRYGLAAAAVAMVAACGAPPAATPTLGAAGKGYLAQTCHGIELFASSGNPRGQCHAELRDETDHLQVVTCDDGAGNKAALTCRPDGEVACKTHGTGVCATDAHAIAPSGAPPANAFASHCGDATYLIVGDHCRASHDAMSGSTGVHCNDGAGDSADFACRDGSAACSATGSATCSGG